MSAQLAVRVAPPAALADLIFILGILATVAWIGWRFGPTLLRLSGWCSFSVAWATDAEGGYGYCA